MQLFYSASSPFVRKCLVSAHELGLQRQLQLEPSNPHPVNRDRPLVARNPLGKVPTLVTDEGTVLYDSRVICDYLNDIGGGGLVPATGPVRWMALVEQSLADGIMDAAVLTRYETAVRPEGLRWPDWITDVYKRQEWLRVINRPSSAGPTNPARLPMELIQAMPAAAPRPPPNI